MTYTFSVRKQLFVFGIVLAVLLFGAQTVSAQVLNGSFEDGDDPGAFANLIPGDTDITDWTVVSGSIDYIGSYWVAADGDRSIDLNGVEAGAISQDLPTVVGATYDVTFMMSGNPAGGPALKELSVTSTSTSSQVFSYTTGANSLGDMMWEPRVYSFVADASTTTLQFTSLIDGAFGPALDDITIVETLPPPPPPPSGGCSTSSSSGSISIVNGIVIVANQSGCISNTTSSSASTGGNSAAGSRGGRGGRGGDVEANASGGSSSGNNGSATAGVGGAGGAGGTGGQVTSGAANATSNTTNRLNRLRIRLNIF